MPSYCIVCMRPAVAGSVTMHRFPTNPEIRKEWLSALNLKPEDIRNHHCICSRHFRNGDISNTPSLYLGKKFRSPKKMLTPHGERARKRQKLSISPPSMFSPSPSPAPSVTSTPVSSDVSDDLVLEHEKMTTSDSEMLLSDCSIFDLPADQAATSKQIGSPSNESSVIVNKALLTRIEVLEAVVKHCQKQLHKQGPSHFRIENIASDDSLIKFYTGFPSYEVFLCFFEFLGPSVHSLNYWGDKKTAKGKRKKKLNPINQLFLTLFKLRQNPKFKKEIWLFGLGSQFLLCRSTLLHGYALCTLI